MLVWSGAERRLVATLAPATQGPLNAFAFSADDRWLAAAYQDCAAGAWNLQTGSWHPIRAANFSTPALVAWSRTGNLLALTPDQTQGGDSIIWDMDREQLISSFYVGALPQTQCFVDDDRTLAVGHAEDGLITLWDVRTGQRLKDLTGHTGRINRLWLSQEGRTLASRGDDGTVRFWHVPTRRELFVAGEDFYHGGFAFTGEGSLHFAHEQRCDLMILPGPNHRPAIDPVQ